MRLKLLSVTLLILCCGNSAGLQVKAGPLESAQAELVAGNFAKAAALYEGIAEKGNAAAQYNLGVMYAKGEGVTRDYILALKWLRRSADQGFARAQFLMGNMIARGVGAEPDLGTALFWLSLASQQGLPQAVQELADVKKRVSPAGLAKNESLIRAWKPKIEADRAVQ